MGGGAYTLADCVRAGIVMLEMECSKCDRYGRRRVDRLIAEYGADCSLPDLKAMLAADCPKQRSVNYYDRCGARFVNPPGR